MAKKKKRAGGAGHQAARLRASAAAAAHAGRVEKSWAVAEEPGWDDDGGGVDVWLEREEDRVESLRLLQEARQGVTDALREQDDAARAARALGASWGQIGRCLGISQQAAHRRYAGSLASMGRGETS